MEQKKKVVLRKERFRGGIVRRYIDGMTLQRITHVKGVVHGLKISRIFCLFREVI
jgi:hypothetical protein